MRSIVVSLLALIGTATAGFGPAIAAGYHVEYSFSTPSAGGIVVNGLLAYEGKFYGTINGGGSKNCKGGCGTVFSFDPRTGAETQLYAFAGGSDGAFPNAGLIELAGKLYGTTLFGGGSSFCHNAGCGTVFSLDLSSGVESVVHAFTGGTDGYYPQAGPTQFGSKLYGTTIYGGTLSPCSCGTVYSLDPASAQEKVLYAFTGGDGAYPFSGLIKAGGLLYGTVQGGGSSYCNGNGCGTVFSFDPKSRAMTVVYAFKGGDDGATPYGGLLGVGDLLYGTTGFGGPSSRHVCGNGCGVVFSLEPATGAETVLYAFAGGNDAEYPRSDLTIFDGVLYGTTQSGAARKSATSYGTVFSVDPATGAEAIVHAFKGGTAGSYPGGGLTKFGRMLFGTTEAGGAGTCSCGTLYSLRP